MSNDNCIEKRCGCTEHVLNKIVKYLENNPGQEKSSPKCEPHHNVNNGYEMVRSISENNYSPPSDMILPAGNMLTGEFLQLADGGPELVDKTKTANNKHLNGKIDHEVAMRRILKLPDGGITLKSGLSSTSND